MSGMGVVQLWLPFAPYAREGLQDVFIRGAGINHRNLALATMKLDLPRRVKGPGLLQRTRRTRAETSRPFRELHRMSCRTVAVMVTSTGACAAGLYSGHRLKQFERGAKKSRILLLPVISGCRTNAAMVISTSRRCWIMCLGSARCRCRLSRAAKSIRFSTSSAPPSLAARAAPSALISSKERQDCQSSPSRPPRVSGSHI